MKVSAVNQCLSRCDPKLSMIASILRFAISGVSGMKKFGEPKSPSYLGISYSSTRWLRQVFQVSSQINRLQSLVGGAKLKDRIQFAFGAEFVEVRVHKATREIRTPRIVGAFAAGRIMNERTARSQLMGGLIWGVSSALHEATEIDRRSARFYNTDLAEYMIPVNADIAEVDVLLIPEVDSQVNELGIKGLGELGNVGTNAAVANAVYHATGVRVRELPIRLEKLLEA